MFFKKTAKILFLVFLGVSFLLAVKSLFFQKDRWINIQFLSMAGSWWWQSPAPPVWINQQIKKGLLELDFSGRPVAEITEVVKWPVADDNSSSLRDYASGKYLISARVKVREQPLSKKLWFKDNPAAIGQPIVIETNNLFINGNILWMEGAALPPQKQVLIKLVLYHKYPWEIEEVRRNLPLILGEKKIFEIKSVTAVPSAIEAFEKERVIRYTALVDIFVEAAMEVEFFDEEMIFLKEQKVKVGKDLFIPLNNYDLVWAKIKEIKVLD